MSNYCDTDAVRAQHKSIDEIDFPDDVVLPFIEKAQTRIDSRLRSFYRVPFAAPVPKIIASICADMAAGMILQNHYSEIQYRENVPLASVYLKRAESDLQDLIDTNGLEGLPGVATKAPDAPEKRRSIYTTTPRKSPLGAVLSRHDGW